MTPVTHTRQGVIIRNWRKDSRSADVALWLAVSMGATEYWPLMGMARRLCPEKPATAYQSIQRALPFEANGAVYSVESLVKPERFRSSKMIVHRPGRLEDWMMPAPKARASRKALEDLVNEAVAKRLAEVEGFINLYALREEAWRYMQGVEERFEARLRKLEERR